MEIKHPETEYVSVKVKKAKLDREGNIIYVVEDQKLPKAVLEVMSKDVFQDENNDEHNKGIEG